MIFFYFRYNLKYSLHIAVSSNIKWKCNIHISKIHGHVHEKNSFVEVSKNLVGYIFENNFVWIIKYNYVGLSNWLLEYQNFLFVTFKRSVSKFVPKF